MDAWKSPKRFVADMMDSIELVIIELPVAKKYEDLDDESESTGIATTDTRSQSSSNRTFDVLAKSWLRNPLKEWWATHVSALVPQDVDIRDFLALERTFLGHFHTSVALIEVSVYISQWYTLSSYSTPDTPNTLGLQNIGKLLSCTLISWAMVVNIIGAVRFFRMQDCMLKKTKIKTGEWDLKLEGLGILVILVVILILTLVEEG